MNINEINESKKIHKNHYKSIKVVVLKDVKAEDNMVLLMVNFSFEKQLLGLKKAF